MKPAIYCFIFVVALLMPAPVFAQNKHETAKRIQETIKRLAPIKAYVKSVEAEFENRGPDLVVTDISDYNSSEKAEWKWYRSREEFENSEQETYTTAFIWKSGKDIVQVNFTYSSPSGDWVQYVFHTFYGDGKAARIDRELRTFMGDVIVNRVSYYDTDGNPVANNVAYRDLQTQKLIMKPESFSDFEADVFLKLDDLPFNQKAISGPVN